MIRWENRSNVKKAGLIGLACGMLFLTACGGNKDSGSYDVISQKKVEEGRTAVTILVKYAFSINSFEKAVEEKFPDIDIVQIGNYTPDMGIEEYSRRLEHDDLTDIVMTWPLDAGEEYWADRLLDLSGEDFTSRYKLSMLNNISRDGTLYYLPGPSQVRGILYNKTLFQENGWEVPGNYEEFTELCKTIEASGIRSIQLGFENSEVLNTAFTGFNFGSCFSKPEDQQWIANYNKGTGSFGDHFGPALDVFQQMTEEGIWKPSDLEIEYSKRETMLYARECAMVEDSALLARRGHEISQMGDEFALMPFFNPGSSNDWARLYMVCYVGVNKHLAEPENRDKYRQVMKIMDFISTPEGQEAMMADTGAMFSSLNDMDLPDVPEIESLIPVLRAGRYAVFGQLEHGQEALEEGLAGMLRGEKTKEDVIQMVDEQNKKPVYKADPEIYGTAASDFTLIQTGNFITDAMRGQSGAEIALFMDNGKDGLYNGKGLSGRLYKGDVTNVDLKCILPDLKSPDTGEMRVIKITGENLIETLEKSIVVDNQSGWFYYFSGLSMSYDPAAEPGKRIGTIQTADGHAIDKEKVYTVAIMDTIVPESFILESESTGMTVYDVLVKTLEEKQNIEPVEDGRFAAR